MASGALAPTTVVTVDGQFRGLTLFEGQVAAASTPASRNRVDTWSSPGHCVFQRLSACKLAGERDLKYGEYSRVDVVAFRSNPWSRVDVQSRYLMERIEGEAFGL